MVFEDYLAWSILALFYLAAGVPIVGSWATNMGSGYKDDWKAGVVINIGLCCFATIAFFVVWAFIWVTK